MPSEVPTQIREYLHVTQEAAPLCVHTLVVSTLSMQLTTDPFGHRVVEYYADLNREEGIGSYQIRTLDKSVFDRLSVGDAYTLTLVRNPLP